jgi:hypothetical protein
MKQVMKKVARRIERVGERLEKKAGGFVSCVYYAYHTLHFFNTSSWFLLVVKGCKE